MPTKLIGIGLIFIGVLIIIVGLFAGYIGLSNSTSIGLHKLLLAGAGLIVGIVGVVMTMIRQKG